MIIPIVNSRIIVLPTIQPQHLYKDSSGSYGPFNPSLPLRTATDGFVPQLMHKIIDKNPDIGQYYYDEIDDLVYKCTSITNGMVHNEKNSINEVHAFKIVGSTDKTLNVLPINITFLKYFCEHNGETENPLFNKAQLALFRRAMIAGAVHGQLIGAFTTSDLGQKYAPATIDAFVTAWMFKNLEA